MYILLSYGMQEETGFCTNIKDFGLYPKSKTTTLIKLAGKWDIWLDTSLKSYSAHDPSKN